VAHYGRNRRRNASDNRAIHHFMLTAARVRGNLFAPKVCTSLLAALAFVPSGRALT